jgi:hypothetical protein
MIVPTVGRVVYFHPGEGARSRMHVRGDQPLRADILYVYGDRHVALNVDDHEGQRHFIPHATLMQDGDMPPDGSYAEWMPYQTAVAKGQIKPTLHAAGASHVSTKGTDLDSH